MRLRDLIAGALLAAFAFYIPWNHCDNSAVDVSFILDAPAGKHGFVTVKDGHFYFEDGLRAKFWGVNIHSSKACFPTHAQAIDIAKRLGQLGCNAVRMHFLDYESPNGVIDAGHDDSQRLSDVQMEKLDYFIYQLKLNGIYTCFDVLGLGVRRFKSGDNVPESGRLKSGAPGISFFNERIKELSKKFASDFLSHVNPYTGSAYKDEPAIAFVELTNENTILSEYFYDLFPPYYKNEIQRLWEDWLITKQKDKKPASGGWARDKEFLFELQDGFQQEMYGYLRSIGVKTPIGSSNLPYDNLTLLADSHMDFVDIHVYWDLCDLLDVIHNRPLIMQHPLNERTIINRISTAKVHNKPLVSTEWGSNWPNEWRAVDMLSTVSYAALNDWDALFLYCYNGGYVSGWDNLEKRLYFGTVVFNDPAKMGLFPLASLIFLRGDVKAASGLYQASYDTGQIFDRNDLYGQDSSRLAGIPYISRLEKIFYGTGAREVKNVSYPDPESLSIDKRLVSDTGEIIRDPEKGIFVLNTPRTCSFSGFVGNVKECEFNGIRFTTESDFATLTITSLDGKDISESERLLLAAVGKVHNTNQRLSPNERKRPDDLRRNVKILNTGTSPILVEDVEGAVFINNKGKFKVFSLSEEGIRKSEVPVKIQGNACSFDISGAYDTIYYEIIKERES